MRHVFTAGGTAYFSRMDELQKRRSRAHSTRTGKRIEITPRDLELFALLARYRYLRSNFLYAFLGGASEKRFKERLGHLFHEGRYINRPEQQWQFVNSRYMPAVYELGDAGAVLLRDVSGDVPRPERGRKPTRQFAHALMISEVLASVELGTRAVTGLRFITAAEILSKAPERTRHSERPLELEVPGAAETRIVPDALFGIEYGQKTYRFFVLEADRGTMPATRSDTSQSSFVRKIQAYRAIAAVHAQKSHWGVPNLLVLTVTTSEAHMRSLMATLETCAGASTMFLFKAAASFGSVLTAPAPSPKMLTEPWLRVGHDPLELTQ